MKMTDLTISNDNYWKGIKKPAVSSDVSTRKVLADFPAGVMAFWARSYVGNPALLIEHPDQSPRSDLPHFKFIKVSSGVDSARKKGIIWIELLDEGMLGQFSLLCVDIIKALTRSVDNQAVMFIKLQLEKWSHLLSPTRLPLGSNEQKGLIAELLFLERYAMKYAAPIEAIASWTGPLKSPRDFSFGNTFVEVKSNKGAQNPSVTISSEHQLTTSDDETLLLYVVGLNEAHGNNGFSLDDVVERIYEELNSDYLALEQLMLRLAAVGYGKDESYKEYRWEESDSISYWVIGDFPRLQSGDVPVGVSKTKYEIDLNACADYALKEEKLLQMIGVDNG